MMGRRLGGSFIVTLLVLLATGCYPPTSHAYAPKTNSLAHQLQEVLDHKVEELKVPGIQVAVRRGDFYWSGTSGTIGFKNKEGLAPDHVFRVGSVTKTFTAALILKLYEQGKIDLDDKLSTWFPDYPQAASITVRHLLNHSSGIYNYTENLWLTARTFLRSKKRWDPAQLLESTFKRKFSFPPGTGHYYSNTNYIILGLIAEKITGKALLEAYREYLFTPAKLNNTYFVPYEEAPEKLVTGYDRDLFPFGVYKLKPEATSFATLAYAAGTVASTAEDLRRWIDTLLASDFLTPEVRGDMMRYLEATDPDVPGQLGYGLGLRVLAVGDDLIFGHTGTIPGFGAAAFYCPEKDYSVAVVSNLSLFDQTNVVGALVQILNLNY